MGHEEDSFGVKTGQLLTETNLLQTSSQKEIHLGTSLQGDRPVSALHSEVFWPQEQRKMMPYKRCRLAVAVGFHLTKENWPRWNVAAIVVARQGGHTATLER